MFVHLSECACFYVFARGEWGGVRQCGGKWGDGARTDGGTRMGSGTYVDCSIKFPPPSAGTARKCAAPTASPADDSSGDAQDLQHLGFKFMRTEKPEAGCADPRQGLAKRMVFHYTLRTVDQDGDMIK